MKLKTLSQRPDIKSNDKLDRAYTQFGQLIQELADKKLPDEVLITINKDIEEINSSVETGKDLGDKIKKKQSRILKLLERELKLVPRNHYRNTWLVIGMAAFGIPLGVAFGTTLGNMGFLGIGIPIGLAIGIAVGTGMDKEAIKQGRQLDLEL